MKLPKRHGPTLFLFVMVTIMVIVMSFVLGLVNGAFEDGLWPVWPRQAVVAFAVAFPTAFVARWIAMAVVAKFTA